MCVYIKDLETGMERSIPNALKVGENFYVFSEKEPGTRWKNTNPFLRLTGSNIYEGKYTKWGIEVDPKFSGIAMLCSGKPNTEKQKPIPEPIPKAQSESAQTEAKPTPQAVNNADAVASSIAAALRSLTPQAAVDADTVRSIVQDEIKKLAVEQPHEISIIKTNVTGHDDSKHPMFEKVLPLVVNDRTLGRWPWLFGPAGSGKSSLAKQIADELKLPFYSVSSLQQKYELEGYTDATGNLVETSFYKAWTEGGVFLFDEASTSSAEVQVAFNTALANLRYNFPKVGMMDAHPDFHILAADNTAGWGGDKSYHARFEMDASTLDRYIPVQISYTDEFDLRMASQNNDLVKFVKDVRKALAKADLAYTASPRALKCITALEACNTYSPEEIMKMGLCGSWDKQDIKTVANELKDGTTFYHTVFISMAHE